MIGDGPQLSDGEAVLSGEGGYNVYGDREALCTGFAGRLSLLALLGFQTS